MNNIKEDLNIIYEDNHIIVVEKIVGVPSQLDKTGDMDMLTLVKQYIRKKYEKKGEVYLGLVHRLDRMVGGIMVFAKTSKAASRLSKNIREHDFKKRYLAVVNGKIENAKNIVLENYLVKNEKTNTSKTCDKDTKNAKLASLEYSSISNFVYNSKEYSLIDILLHTGRHHQIRVQMSAISHPLYSDSKYGGSGKEDIALFAYSLSFPHPTKDEIMEFKLYPKKEGIWSVLKEI